MHSRHKPKKLKFHSAEKWITLRGYKGADGQRYAISNYGRFVSYWETYDNGYFLKHSFARKYPIISLRKDGKGETYLIHRLVAKHFCKQPSSKHNFVIHLDHKKDNNQARNLKWVTHEDFIKHVRKHPSWYANRAIVTGKGHKLTTEKVKTIKKKIAAGKTRMKVIAKQFGISEMQLYRIKKGENWAHVKI